MDPNSNQITSTQFHHHSGFIPQIQNLVATVNLGCSLDLKRICIRARNGEYNPRRFPALIMRIRCPKVTSLVFSSGKLVVTGAKSEESARLAARKIARIIQRIGYESIRFSNFKIENVVAGVDCRFPIRLESLSSGSHEDLCNYEPELFPGLVYRMQQPKLVLLIFVSGNVLITGGKSEMDVYSAFEQIYPVLLEYRKTQ